MKVFRSTMLAVSLAGHDKGHLHVVLEEESSCGIPEEGPVYYLLADGKRRTLEHPKRKKDKHVQLILDIPEELLSQMREITEDAHVRKILREYIQSRKFKEV